MRIDTEGYCTIADCGLPTDTFNIVCSTRFSPDEVDRGIRRVVAYFAGRRLPFAWWVGPADRPADLGQSLLRNRFSAVGREPGMVADLTRLPPAGLPPWGLRIEPVTSARRITDFARTLAALWVPPDLNVVRFYDAATAALLSADCPIQLYVGYAGGGAIACAELVIAGGVAGLYNIATIPAWRNKGIGTAMTTQVLLDARAAGCRAAVLQASDAGFHIYSRLGFRKFCEFTEYQTHG
jgi:GNAT superfamily N-acetyltransferase